MFSVSCKIKLYLKSARQAGMSLEKLFLENSFIHSGISLTRWKPLTGGMTKVVHENGFIFA